MYDNVYLAFSGENLLKFHSVWFSWLVQLPRLTENLGRPKIQFCPSSWSFWNSFTCKGNWFWFRNRPCSHGYSESATFSLSCNYDTHTMILWCQMHHRPSIISVVSQKTSRKLWIKYIQYFFSVYVLNNTNGYYIDMLKETLCFHVPATGFGAALTQLFLYVLFLLFSSILK